VRAALAALLLVATSGCRPAPPAAGPHFRDVAAETGLRFEHFNGATGKYFMPEIMGAGVALIDYDNDGDLDIFLVQGSSLDGSASAPVPGHRLFRNELVPSGKLQFTDVTAAAGLGGVSYGMGVAVGDYNGDGYPDLYVTGFGRNILYRNNGNGTFTDVTAAAGVADDLWSTSAAFADFDRDGRLDLIVLHYVDFTVAGNKACQSATGERDYCTPKVYRGLPARLFRNLGGGRFADVTARAGISAAYGPGLGVICADFNGDGWPDIFVANDTAPNLLWVNQKNGTFREMALASGVAYAADGVARAGMGVTAADFDGDGSEDLLITNLTREGVTLFRNDGKGQFEDATVRYALARPTVPFTGFGAGWFDYDNDGRLDLFIANGAVTMVEALRGKPYPFEQTNQLLHHEGARYRDVSAAAGAALAQPGIGRGAAFGDIDNDGAMDIVVTNNRGPVRLLLNQSPARGHWLGVRLQDDRGDRMALGGRVAVLRRGLAPLWQRVHTDGSYLSAQDPRVHFGLGDRPDVEAVEVIWPDGAHERFERVPADRIVTLRRAEGRTEPRP
jgi:hypothetical protein